VSLSFPVKLFQRDAREVLEENRFQLAPLIEKEKDKRILKGHFRAIPKKEVDHFSPLDDFYVTFPQLPAALMQ
jgi:hypothetical protein